MTGAVYDDPPGAVIDGRYRVDRRKGWDTHATDLVTGEPVLVYPRAGTPYGDAFVYRTVAETVARTVASLGHPSIVCVRAWSPRVVIDVPPPRRRTAKPRGVEDIAACALLALDAVAALHAAGLTEVWLALNARFRRRSGEWALALIHPSRHPGWITESGSVRHDLRDFAYLLQALHRSDLDLIEARRRRHSGAEDLPHPTLESIVRRLDPTPSRPLKGMPALPDGFAASARDLAEVILPLAPRKPRWRALVDAMPRVTRVRPVRDWDLLIERGEAALVDEPARVERGREWWLERNRLRYQPAPTAEDYAELTRDQVRYVLYPLGAAYHARACLAIERGDLARARADLDRAVELDPTVASLTTRGYLRATTGDAGGAMDDYAAALHVDAPRDRVDDESLGEDPAYCNGDLALARARYSRGCLRLERGELREAVTDLQRAASHLAAYTREARDEPSELDLRHAPSKEWIARALVTARRRLAST